MTQTLPSATRPRAIAWWLAICAGMVFVMVVLGGATRLTDSGLSMVEWKPLTLLPPLNSEQWQAEFQNYQRSPEFQQKNDWMAVDDFKGIYWLEYTHRIWGRLIGVIFAAPFLWFLWRGVVDRRLAWKLAGLFALGGLQGALGWFMVASGLQDRPDVSHYRLAAHLMVAFILYGLIVWIALDMAGRENHASLSSLDRIVQRLGAIIPFAVLLVVAAGAFVAGLNAGLIYNTFPLMDGRLVPAGLYAMQPWYANLFEDVMTVQFNHRLLAVALAALIGVTWWRGRARLSGRARLLLNALAAMTLAQAALGIATLTLVVPVPLALAHQSGALILFTIAVWFAHEIRPPPIALAGGPAALHVKPAE